MINLSDFELLQECIKILGLTSFNLRRTRITSPFRPDRHPGCYFWSSPEGRIYFVDWALEETHIPIREFYEKLKNGFHPVRRADSYVPLGRSRGKKSAIKILEIEKPMHVKIAKKYFQRYGLEYEDLKQKYGICTVAKYAIVRNGSWKKVVKVEKTDLCLLIMQTPNGKIKLYYPYRKMRRDRLKFVSNVANDDIEFLSRDKSKVIITKSKKDAILLDLLYGHKYDICWVQGEIHPPSEKFIRENYAKYSEIRVFYDNDFVGYRESKVLVKILKTLFPEKEVHSCFIPEELKAKDTAEFIERYVRD